MKSKILLGLAVMFVLMLTLSQQALAYTYPDPPKRQNPGALSSTDFILIGICVGIPLVITVVVFLIRRHKNR